MDEFPRGNKVKEDIMKCIKTGAIVHLPTYNNRYIADVYKSGELIVFRIAKRISPDRYNLHPITHKVTSILGFFDKDRMSLSQNATLITKNEFTKLVRM